jgi:cell wall-associated NlpC family hydrolase
VLFLAIMAWALGYPLVYAGFKGNGAKSNGQPLYKAPWNMYLGPFNKSYAVTTSATKTVSQTDAFLTSSLSSAAQAEGSSVGSAAGTVTGADDASYTAQQNDVVSAALALKNVTKYGWGQAGQAYADCSGWVNYIFEHYAGISIGGYTGTGHGPTSEQTATLGTSVSRKNIQPGDVLVFNIPGEGANSHEGIYLGNNQFISETGPQGALAQIQQVPWTLVSTIRDLFTGGPS